MADNVFVTGQLTGSLSNPSIQIPMQGGDYNKLDNKPQINGVELVGNKNLTELGISPAGGSIEDEDILSNLEIEQIINSIVL